MVLIGRKKETHLIIDGKKFTLSKLKILRRSKRGSIESSAIFHSRDR